MSACAKLRKGWVSPSSLPEHSCREPGNGLDAERRRMTVAINMNVISASIAVYCFQASIFDGVFDGVTQVLREQPAGSRP
jgi:hypothetical protein